MGVYSRGPLIFEILRTSSGWWLPISQQAKNIFKVGNIVKNIAATNVILMSLLLYLDILVGLKI